MACCADPRPAILEKNNRLFCRSCRRYLDAPPEPPVDREPIPETPPATDDVPPMEDEVVP